MRFPNPGLGFGGEGRRPNTNGGYFHVLEARYDVSGALVAFAADFFVEYQNLLGGYDWGSLRWNSDIPLSASVVPAPLPAGAGLTLAGLGLLGALRRQR